MKKLKKLNSYPNDTAQNCSSGSAFWLWLARECKHRTSVTHTRVNNVQNQLVLRKWKAGEVRTTQAEVIHRHNPMLFTFITPCCILLKPSVLHCHHLVLYTITTLCYTLPPPVLYTATARCCTLLPPLLYAARNWPFTLPQTGVKHCHQPMLYITTTSVIYCHNPVLYSTLQLCIKSKSFI